MFTSVEEELDFYIENEEDILNGKEIEDIDEMKTYDLMKEKCTDCNINRIVILEDNNLVCPSCGKCVSMNYFCLSYEESQNIKKTYLYKRVTHFLHWIKLIQGINHVSLKEEEKNNIITMMEDKRDVKSLKLVLKKLKLNKYYKFSYFILNKLFDVELLKLSPYIEYKLKCLFEQIQHPFKKYNKKRRSNFISYQFVLAKFALMLEKPEILNNITMLKSSEKMKQHERLWKKICKYLHWENNEIKLNIE